MITQITTDIFTGAFQDVHECHIYGLRSFHVADVRHIVDKHGNDISYIIEAIRLARSILNDHGRVLITCDMGVSRSRVIAIGLLAELGNDIDDCISLVLRSAKNPEINPDLLLLLRHFYISKKPKDNARPVAAGTGIVVLGSKGFVGAALMRCLAKKQINSIGLSRNEINIKDESVKLLTILDSLEQHTVILCAHPPSHHTAKALSDSILLLKNTLEACRLTGKRLIYISGMIVYLGNAHSSDCYIYPADENTPAYPYGSYSESKYLCEKLIDIYRNSYGVEITVVRPCALYGSDMRPQWLIPKLIRKALNNEDIVTHSYQNGLPSLELLHVDDFCEAITLLINAKSVPPCLNVGSHNLITTYELAGKIIRLTKSKSSRKTMNILDATYAVVSIPGFIETIRWKPEISLEAGLLASLEFSNSF
jgi:UDP-glucuronate decarboxylase